MIWQQRFQIKLSIVWLVPARSFQNGDDFASGFLDDAGLEDTHQLPAIFPKLIQSGIEQRLIERASGKLILRNDLERRILPILSRVRHLDVSDHLDSDSGESLGTEFERERTGADELGIGVMCVTLELLRRVTSRIAQHQPDARQQVRPLRWTIPFQRCWPVTKTSSKS